MHKTNQIESRAMGRGSGEVVFKILDGLTDLALAVPDMIGAILDAGYGASMSKIDYHYNRTISGANHGANRESRRREYQRYSMMVRYLREQGMLAERRSGEVLKVYITKKGRQKLARMRLERRNDKPGYGYEKSPGKKVIIVTYDIPEKQRKDRDWLRAILQRIGLKAMQQSVWIGKVAIPRLLIEDIAVRRMTGFVEIIEVGGTGTFQRLI